MCGKNVFKKRSNYNSFIKLIQYFSAMVIFTQFDVILTHWSSRIQIGRNFIGQQALRYAEWQETNNIWLADHPEC